MGIRDLIKETIIDIVFSHLNVLKSIDCIERRKIGLWDLYELRRKELGNEPQYGTVLAALDTNIDFDYKEDIIKKLIKNGVAKNIEEAKRIVREEMGELTEKIENELWIKYVTLVQWVLSPWGDRDLFVPKTMQVKYTINYVVDIRKEDNKKLQRKIWRGFKKNMAEELTEVERKIEEKLPELLRESEERMKEEIGCIIMEDFWIKHAVDADETMDKVIFRKYAGRVKDIVEIKREEVNMRFNEGFIKELKKVEKVMWEEVEKVENINYWIEKYKGDLDKQQSKGGDME